MPLTLNDGSVTITLPDAMEWVDEYSYDSVKQDVQYMFGGGVALSENITTAGRPITLVGGDGVWVLKTVIDSLVTMRSNIDTDITLTLPDGRVFIVRFDYEETMKATPIWRKNIQEDVDFFTLELKFMEV